MLLDKKKSVDNFFSKIKPFLKLTPACKKLIIDHAEFVHFKPNENFITEGNFRSKLGFLVQGVFRCFFYNEKGEEITSLFLKENDFITNINSFFGYATNSGYLQAETKCEVIVFHRNAWELLSDEIPGLVEALKKYSNDFILAKTSFQRALINLEAQERYQFFAENFPTIVYKLPLGHIASFLGINQSTLSRIRGSKKK